MSVREIKNEGGILREEGEKRQERSVCACGSLVMW